MSERTLGPYSLIGQQGTAIWSGDKIVAQINEPRKNHKLARANAEFIVRAANSFDDLVAALEAIEFALRLPGTTAAEVLDENSPIRDGIRAALAKAKGEA